MSLKPMFERDAQGKPLISLAEADLYQFGHLIRLTEESLLDLFGQGLLSGTTHTCLGQELCQMSVVRALNHPRDAVVSNHRNHGHFLTYSGEFVGLVAELMGREAGVCGGRGGSQHIAYRHFHSNGVQAGMTAIGVGEAAARKMAADGSVVAAIIGDGTLGEGLLYEALNLASVWRVPVLFVVENNHIAQTTPTSRTTGGGIAARGAAFGLRVWEEADGEAGFFAAVEQIVATVRSTREPGFLVIDTQRLGPHSKGDDHRDAAEMEALRARDPLARLGERLPTEARSSIEQKNHDYIAAVKEEAASSSAARLAPAPAPVFSGAECAPALPAVGERPGQNVRGALNESLRRLLRDCPEAVILGEDMHDPYGGAFKVAAGLSTEFGDRIISTPISEAALIGSGIGLAMSGYRPIVEIMFADFLCLGMDQIYNHAVKFPALFPMVSVPIVVRAPSGGRRGYGPTHSQSPENIFTSVPGLTVVFGSNRHDVGRLLENSYFWPYPVLFLEHKLLYGEEVAPGDYEIVEPLDGDPAAKLFPTLRRGPGSPDVTIVTYGGMLPHVEEAAARLAEEEELDVETVVCSLLSPLPKDPLLRCLSGRKRVAIVEESHSEFGVGAEIGALLAENGFHGKLTRVGTPPVPIPAARSLEAATIPGTDQILARILALF